MTNRKGIIVGSIIVVCAIIVVVIICFENCSKSKNEVAGTYRGDVVQLTLNDNYTFNYYLSSTGSSAEGKYSYTMANDGKTAGIKLQVNSGYCTYDGAVIHYYEGSTVLVPTINGSEVLQRRMLKVK